MLLFNIRLHLLYCYTVIYAIQHVYRWTQKDMVLTFLVLVKKRGGITSVFFRCYAPCPEYHHLKYYFSVSNPVSAWSRMISEQEEKDERDGSRDKTLVISWNGNDDVEKSGVDSHDESFSFMLFVFPSFPNSTTHFYSPEEYERSVITKCYERVTHFSISFFKTHTCKVKVFSEPIVPYCRHSRYHWSKAVQPKIWADYWFSCNLTQVKAHQQFSNLNQHQNFVIHFLNFWDFTDPRLFIQTFKLIINCCKI